MSHLKRASFFLILIFKTLNIVGFFLHPPPRRYNLRSEDFKKYMRGKELHCYFSSVLSPVASLTINDEPGAPIRHFMINLGFLAGPFYIILFLIGMPCLNIIMALADTYYTCLYHARIVVATYSK